MKNKGNREQAAEDRSGQAKSSAPMTTAAAVVHGAGSGGRTRELGLKEACEVPGPVQYVKIQFYNNGPDTLSDVVDKGPHVLMARRTGTSLSIDCPACRHRLFIRDATTERTIKCPECGITGMMGPMTPSGDPQDSAESIGR